MSKMADEAVSYIERSPCALLITVGEENKPFVRYIDPFVNNGLSLYFMTRVISEKVRHIETNPFVMLHFQNANQTREDPRSVAVTGKAARVPDGDEFNDVVGKLARKSPGFKKYISSDGFKTWTVYKVTPESLQCTDLSKSFQTLKEAV
jgi:uncharacterized pyridoxamine 5'-phosphate oxidase family protein